MSTGRERARPPWQGQSFHALCATACPCSPLQGLGLQALGVVVGEKTLFRGFLQSAATQGLAGVLPAECATACGLAAASVVFGALHAITPSYFVFATAAGFVLVSGLCRSAVRLVGVHSTWQLCGTSSCRPTPRFLLIPFPFLHFCKQGSEYLMYGLQTAAATHWLYDWIVFNLIIAAWRVRDRNGGGSRSGTGSKR